MNSPALMQLDRVDIGYRGRLVGSRLSLTLGGQEVLCLLGPNGSGKSTLLKTLLGLIPPLSGTVYLGGKPLAQWTRPELAKKLAYVPQAHAGFFPFSVLEVVLMGRSVRISTFSGPSRHDRDIALQCLEQLGIAHLAQRTYTAISGGERQLTLIARALAQQPVLLVMDEPTASLDFGNQIRVLEHVGRLRATGMGIVFSTHQPDHALRLSDRIALLKQGQIHHIGPARDTATAARLAWLYDLDPAQVESGLPGLL